MSSKFGAPFLTLLVTIAFSNTRAETIFDNLGARPSLPPWAEFDSLVYQTSDRRAQQFDTGGLSYRLDSVTMPLHYEGGDSVHVIATLWNTTVTPPSAPIAGQPNPGQLLGLIGSATFSGPAATSYTEFSGGDQLTLEPSRHYWVVVSADQGDASAMSWNIVNVHTSRDYTWTGPGGLYYSARGDAAGNWTVGSMSMQHSIAIEGTAAVVPEPSAFALGALGLAICIAAKKKIRG